MLKHHLLTMLRHFWKRRLYASISLLSLIVGLTVFCLIVLHVRHELSYNTHWPDADRIYRMTHKQGGTGATLPPSTGFSSVFLLNITNYIGEFATSYAEISTINSSVEDSSPGAEASAGIDDSSDQTLQVTFADKAFLAIFDFR